MLIQWSIDIFPFRVGLVTKQVTWSIPRQRCRYFAHRQPEARTVGTSSEAGCPLSAASLWGGLCQHQDQFIAESLGEFVVLLVDAWIWRLNPGMGHLLVGIHIGIMYNGMGEGFWTLRRCPKFPLVDWIEGLVSTSPFLQQLLMMGGKNQSLAPQGRSTQDWGTSCQNSFGSRLDKLG